MNTNTAVLPLPTCVPAPSVWDAPLSVHLARLIVIPLVLYAVFLASLTIPVVQRFMMFLHKAQWPLFAKFDNPEIHGFAPNRVRNLYLRTPDGARIGVWHILPQSVVNERGMTEELPETVFDDTLRSCLASAPCFRRLGVGVRVVAECAFITLRDSKHCVMLYMHGNAGNRILGHRKHLARHVSSGNLNMNMVIFDYRGFGDSSNVAPSEEGLIMDARTVWDWLTKAKGVPARQIVIAGQSLGTGVACALAGRSLAHEGIIPRALVLTAPFTSIRELLLDYKLLERVPVLQPLRYVAPLRNYIFSFQSTHFDSFSVIRNIRCPILLIHSIDDGGIPQSHSQQLFKHLCSDASRGEASETRMQFTHIGKYAILQKLSEPHKSLDVQYLEMHFGGHSDVGYSEVALHTMRDVIFDR